MRVLVCGGRDYADRDAMFATLDAMAAQQAVYLITGGARGADDLAARWALKRNNPARIFVAEWSKDGRAAGPIRNQRMIDEGKPDLVLAFPGGKGTADMVRRAKAAGIPVREIGSPHLPSAGGRG